MEAHRCDQPPAAGYEDGANGPAGSGRHAVSGNGNDFYSAFDYLEITADGRYNFHQAGDPPSAACVWCGTWSFNKSSLWLKLDTAPRLDIYAKDGDMQMTYTAEPDKKSKYKWLVFGWTKME